MLFPFELKPGQKVLRVIWFQPMSPQPYGIVLIENMVGERKIYAGSGYGGNELHDIKSIVDRGGKIDPENLRELLAAYDKAA